jgi:hypothetical protein
VGTLENFYAHYGEFIEFFVVYIREAHSRQGWPVPIDPEGKRFLDDPETFEEREATAATCVLDLRISIPCLIDNIDDTAARAYKAYPDRLYLIGLEGRIAYAGGPGPRQFKPKELKPYLKQEMEKMNKVAAAS